MASWHDFREGIVLLNDSKFDWTGVNASTGGSRVSAIDLGGLGMGSKSAIVIAVIGEFLQGFL